MSFGELLKITKLANYRGNFYARFDKRGVLTPFDVAFLVSSPTRKKGIYFVGHKDGSKYTISMYGCGMRFKTYSSKTDAVKSFAHNISHYTFEQIERAGDSQHDLNTVHPSQAGNTVVTPNPKRKRRVFKNPDTLNRYGAMFPMGSGERIDTVGTVKITDKERKKYSTLTSASYHPSLSGVCAYVLNALDLNHLAAIHQGEKWSGTFSGALSDGQTTRVSLELVKVENSKERNPKTGRYDLEYYAVKNAMLILYIYKMDKTTKITYELNTYLS